MYCVCGITDRLVHILVLHQNSKGRLEEQLISYNKKKKMLAIVGCKKEL